MDGFLWDTAEIGRHNRTRMLSYFGRDGSFTYKYAILWLFRREQIAGVCIYCATIHRDTGIMLFLDRLDIVNNLSPLGRSHIEDTTRITRCCYLNWGPFPSCGGELRARCIAHFLIRTNYWSS